MKEFFHKLYEVLRGGGAAVVVFITASSGSTPRGAGARMLVTQGGRLCGTIGGGAVEHQCELAALEVLKEKSSCARHFRLHTNQVQDIGMICGGAVDVYFSYIPAGDVRAITIAQKAAALFARGEEAWLISDITQDGGGGMALYTREDGFTGMDMPQEIVSSLYARDAAHTLFGRTYYCERLLQAGRVYIFGGGHVSQALVPALAAVDFRCVILEDRAEFAAPALFPGVEKTHLIDITRVADYVQIGAEDYIAIMTRGHKDDMRIMAQALRTPARYIGVIGSAAKKAGVFARLKEEGFTDGDLARIVTPIGLSIGAQTPAEIAVSIAAQLIQVRAES